MSAEAIRGACRKVFGEKKVLLVCIGYRDKVEEKIVGVLKPIISEVKILRIESERAISRDRLESILNTLKIPFSDLCEIPDFSIGYYLIFGSFSVVESFWRFVGEHRG